MNMKKDPRFKRALNAAHAEEIRRATETGKYDLTKSEKWWRDRIQILDDHGYELRPRLKPGWSPSWKGTDMDPEWCEDSLNSFVSKLDPPRISRSDILYRTEKSWMLAEKAME